MDLRKRLVWVLGALLGGLIVVALLIHLHSLREDIRAEVSASERLVNVLLRATRNPAPTQDELVTLLADASLRHLRIGIDHPAPATASGTERLAAFLGIAAQSQDPHTIRLGNHTLYIAPNPASEIEERLGDTVQLCSTLLLFSGATLLMAWWSAHRALNPVRELEAGLMRLAAGEASAELPAFALREFRYVASAIEALAKALSSSRKAQQLLARQLIQVQEDERRTLARELHDEMGQTLTAIGVTAAYMERNAEKMDSGQVAECAGDLRRDVRTSGEQLRAMLKRLRPHGLDASELASALRELVAGWQQRSAGIDFSLTLPAQLPALGEAAGLVLYRVVQEALTNVVRHSGASHCRISVELDSEGLQLTIIDDGQGLPMEGVARRGGLLGMAERLEMVGGHLEAVRSSSQSGLCLKVGLPLKTEEQQEEVA